MRIEIHNGPTLEAQAEAREEAAQAARDAGYDIDETMGVEQTDDDNGEAVWLVYCGLELWGRREMTMTRNEFRRIFIRCCHAAQQAWDHAPGHFSAREGATGAAWAAARRAGLRGWPLKVTADAAALRAGVEPGVGMACASGELATGSAGWYGVTYRPSLPA